MPHDIAILNALDRLRAAASGAEPQATVAACRALQRAMADLAGLPMGRRNELAGECARQIRQATSAMEHARKTMAIRHPAQRAYGATSQVGQ